MLLSFASLSDLDAHALAMLKAFGAGALIATAVETMIPELECPRCRFGST